jgi:hypothetical protein
MYFKTRDMVAIALFAALWGILNSTLSPIIFRMTGLPIFCDMIGFASLILAVWWVRKLGTATAVGIVATIINFVSNPGGIHFLGFTAASFVFDILTRIMGYGKCFGEKIVGGFLTLIASAASAAVAGFIIGSFFMAAPALARWGGVLGWMVLHMAGGIVGWVIGIALVLSLEVRGLRKARVGM